MANLSLRTSGSGVGQTSSSSSTGVGQVPRSALVAFPRTIGVVATGGRSIARRFRIEAGVLADGCAADGVASVGPCQSLTGGVHSIDSASSSSPLCRLERRPLAVGVRARDSLAASLMGGGGSFGGFDASAGSMVARSADALVTSRGVVPL